VHCLQFICAGENLRPYGSILHLHQKSTDTVQRDACSFQRNLRLARIDVRLDCGRAQKRKREMGLGQQKLRERPLEDALPRGC
jgi:hypothetical protein